MIDRFNDYAANERTYLAWIRTAIAIMAFGFLIEKFDLFLQLISQSLGDKVKIHYAYSTEVVGVLLMVLAILIIALSSVKFVINKKKIQRNTKHRYGSSIPDVMLGLLLFIIAGFLVIYIGHAVID